MLVGSSAERCPLYGAREPVISLAWGPPPDPGTVALSTLFRLVCFGGSWLATIAVDRGREVGDGCDRRAPGGAGCPQGAGDRLRAGARRRPRAALGGPRVLDDGRRAVGAARLAEGSWGDAGGDGGHERVLEAGVGRARGRLRAAAGQRPARQEPSRSQDRRQGCRVAVPAAGGRPVASELRAA